ncbi:Mu transposase C-terminal domain-containing protein [Rhizobium sp.]|uniref:Mu transposase C-terminal domain-containing protein n=1 Tax=Rhizobium sp. TaxID=391 RepID=UPI0028B0AA49
METIEEIKPLSDYTRFHIGPDDLVKIHGRELRYARAYGNEGVILRGVRSNTDAVTKVLYYPVIADLFSQGKLEIISGYFSERAAIDRARKVEPFEMLPEETLRAVMVSKFISQELDIDEPAERYHRSDRDLAEFMAIFAVENEELVEEARRSLLLKGKEKVFLSPRQFRRLLTRFEDSCLDPLSMASRNDGRARMGSTFSQKDIAFHLKFVEKYRTPDQNTMKECWEEMRDENDRRMREGLTTYRLPSLTTFQRLVKEGNDFLNEAGRSRNRERIERKYAFAKQGLQVTRPLQVVEMDDKEVDLVVMFTKNELWDRLHDDVKKKIVDIGRVNICVALDAYSRSVLGMKIIKGAPTAASAVDTLAMVAQNKDHISALVGAVTGWPQCGTPEAIHTDAGSNFVSGRFELSVMLFSGRHRIPPSKHPHLRARLERFFRTINQRYTPLFSAQTFSNPLMKDEYDSKKYVHLTEEEFAALLVRLIVDCYHNTKHRSLGMTPLEAWYRGSQFGNGGIMPPPDAETYRGIFGITLSRSIGNTGIYIAGNIYSSHKLLEVRKKWFRAKLIVRLNEQDIGSISVKHRRLNSWIEVPAVFDGLKGVTLAEWRETVRYLEGRFGTAAPLNQEVVRKGIAKAKKTISLSKKREGIFVHKDPDKWIEEIESEMSPNFGYSQDTEYDYGSYDDGKDDFSDPRDMWWNDLKAGSLPADEPFKDSTLPDIDETSEDYADDEVDEDRVFDNTGFASDEERLAEPGTPVKKRKPTKTKPAKQRFTDTPPLDPSQPAAPSGSPGKPHTRMSISKKPKRRPGQ